MLGLGGGGGGALVSTVVGAIADGAAEGALVTGGGIGAALDGGGGGAVVVVIGTVGSTTPVLPNGCRDTTVIADTVTQTATNPRTPAVTALDQRGPGPAFPPWRIRRGCALVLVAHALGYLRVVRHV